MRKPDFGLVTKDFRQTNRKKCFARSLASCLVRKEGDSRSSEKEVVHSSVVRDSHKGEEVLKNKQNSKVHKEEHKSASKAEKRRKHSQVS